MNRWDVLDAVVLSGRQCLDAPTPTDDAPFPVCARHALTANQRHVMHCLVRRADAQTAVIPRWRQPSLRELAADCNLVRSTVQNVVRQLEELGWLVIERPSRRAPAQYGLAIPSEPTGGPLSEPQDRPLSGLHDGPLGDALDASGPRPGPLSGPPHDASGPGDGPQWSVTRTTTSSPVSESSSGGSSGSSSGSRAGDRARPAREPLPHRAYRVDCPWPSCQRPVGEPCRSRSGTVLDAPHEARMTAHAHSCQAAYRAQRDAAS